VCWKDVFEVSIKIFFWSSYVERLRRIMKLLSHQTRCSGYTVDLCSFGSWNCIP